MLRKKIFNYFLFFPVILLFLFGHSDKKEPCVKVSYDTASYAPYEVMKYVREYPDCNDKRTYYERSYCFGDKLNQEGNKINNLREGVWKICSCDSFISTPTDEWLYFHGKKIRETSLGRIDVTVHMNDSVEYEIRDHGGEEYSKGFSIGGMKKFGLWEEQEIDSARNKIKSIGNYNSYCDTFHYVVPSDSMISHNLPLYHDYIDTIICYESKNGVWFYFDEQNHLLRTEKYEKGKLVK